MSAREELAAILDCELEKSPDLLDDEWMGVVADAILAAGYRKPRTADTVEELDALPNGTKLIEPHNGHIWFKRGDKWRCTCAWETDTAESWDDTSAELLDESSGNTLVVLYAPEVGEA